MPRLPYTLRNASTALIRLNYDCRKGLWRPTPAFTAQEVVGQRGKVIFLRPHNWVTVETGH